jgi:hypothetical protein
MDAALHVSDRIAVIANALAHFDLDSVYVPPLIRARIESFRLPPRRTNPTTEPPRPGRPGLARTRPSGAKPH